MMVLFGLFFLGILAFFLAIILILIHANCDGFINGCFVLFVIGLFSALFGIFLQCMEDNKKPTFSLKKADWECIESHTESSTIMILVGKVMVPQIHTTTVCDDYKRIK